MFSQYMIIAVFYILGIIISKSYDMSAMFFTALIIFFTGIVRLSKNRKQAISILLLSAIFLFGGARYFDKSENRLYSEFPDKYVTVSGTVYSLPSTSDSKYCNRYILKTESVFYLDKIAYCDSRILINTKESLPFGTKVTVSGFLSEIEGINNEGEFDFQLYYKGKGIFARLTALDVTITGNSFSISPEFLFGELRYQLKTLIENRFQGNSAAFLNAIITGDKSGFSADYTNLLIQTGIYRILYSPFMHIWLIVFIAGLLPFNKQNRDRVILFLITLYALANSSSPTIMKAALLFGVLVLSRQLYGYANKLDIISKILLLMTVFEPLLCFDSGFIMSVGTTVVLYFSYKPIFAYFFGRFKGFKMKKRRFFAKALTLCIILLFGTLPLGACLFNGISLYSVLFTLLLTPVIIAVLLISPIMLLSLAIFGTSPVLAPITGAIMDFIAYVPGLISKLPWYYIGLRTPKILEIVGFYLLWWLFLSAIRGQLKTIKNRLIAISVAGLLISGLLFYSPNTLRVYFVNVGQGDGAVLHTTRGETVLIDGGGAAEYETNYNIGERVFVPYLISHGFSHIDVAIVSHCHKDHVEGIIAAAENLSIDTIVMPKSDMENIYHQKLIEIAQEKGISIEYMAKGDEINFKSGLSIDFLAPDSSQLQNDEANDTSLVAHITYGNFSALFTGDSTDEADEIYPKNVDILKVAHHGSDNQTSAEYLEITNPEYAVISVGKGNSYNLPSDGVIERLTDGGAKILRTDRNGDIQFKAKKDGTFTYKTLKGE